MVQVDKRKTSIEILRCLSMILVVAIHLFTKTSVLYEIAVDSPVYWIVWILYGFCVTAVNCFVLITGYFMVNADFKVEKLLKLYTQVLFYSIVIALVVKFGLHLELKLRWQEVFFPITGGEYWFVTVYLVLYILSPFVNILVKNLDQKTHKHLLLILCVLFSVIPTVRHVDGWLGDGGAYGITWFIFLYLIGTYIRKYSDGFGKKKFGRLYLLTILLIPTSKYVIMLFGREVSTHLMPEKVLDASETLYEFNSLPALLASVFLFLFFVNIRDFPGKIARLAVWGGKFSFGVYLIHNNPNFSHFLWEKLGIDYWLIQKRNIIIPIVLLILVYISCSFLEYLRECLFNLCRINQLIDKIADRVYVTKAHLQGRE